MDDQVMRLTALATLVTGLSLLYAQRFGDAQCQLVEWVIAAGKVPGRWRGLLNLGVGVALALAFTGLGALVAGDATILAAGCLAGVLASIQAAKAHDQADASPPAPEPEPPAAIAAVGGQQAAGGDAVAAKAGPIGFGPGA